MGRSFRLQADVDTVVAALDRVGRNAVIVAPGRVAGARMKIPAVPRTAQPSVLDRTLAEGPALVRAGVGEGGVGSFEMGDGQAHSVGYDSAHTAFRELIGSQNVVPDEVGVVAHDLWSSNPVIVKGVSHQRR